MGSKKILSIAFGLALAVASILVLTGLGVAQGRYVNTYSKNQVSNIIKRAENSSDKFRTDFRNQMDRNNNLSGSQKAQFNNNVANCEDSLDRLRRRFDSENTWWNTRNEVQNVISSSQNVNTMMNILPFRRNLERQWTSLRNDINTLADTYDLPGLNGGGWNGGPWNPGNPGGGGGGNVPNWARGTFYGRNPETGGTITMTVAQNGSVTLVFDGGAPSYATMNGTILQNGPYRSRVSRINNGIRTTDTRNNSYIDYFRNGGGGPIGGSVPSWAIGTFYARNPQNGGRIVMTVNQNGSVVLTYDGTNPTYATISGTLLTNGPYTSRVTQIRNGIRTTSTSDGSAIDYYRQNR